MHVSELWLLRHGESTWNAARRVQGLGDPPLTAVGRAQALAAAGALLTHPPDAIVCSPLRRARESACIVASVLGLSFEIDERWREHDVGAWTGLRREEIRTRWPQEHARLRAGDRELRRGGGESRGEVAARASAAAEALREQYAGQKVLVVTHRGVIRALLPDVRPSNGSLHLLAWRPVAA